MGSLFEGRRFTVYVSKTHVHYHINCIKILPYFSSYSFFLFKNTITPLKVKGQDQTNVNKTKSLLRFTTITHVHIYISFWSVVFFSFFADRQTNIHTDAAKNNTCFALRIWRADNTMNFKVTFVCRCRLRSCKPLRR